MSRVAGAPQLIEVAEVLDTYFTGINRHDAEMAASVFSKHGVVNPNDPDQVAQFGRGISTTRDDQISIISIKPGEFKGRPGLAVTLRFRSRQAASLGPKNQPCTKWKLTEQLVRSGDSYKLLGVQDVQFKAC